MFQTTEEVTETGATNLSSYMLEEIQRYEELQGPTPKYKFDEVLEAALKYFKGDKLAANTWVTKYALRDPHKNFLELTPVDMHRRLARAFARIEKNYPNPMSEEDIFELFVDWTVVPQGSPMSGVGNPYKLQSVSNCFVLTPPADSYGGLLRVDEQQAQIMKRRGGVGFDISTIRPKGVPTMNAAQTTDGIGVFMERYSRTCQEVAQGGRRGALMLSCDVHHPEILTFIRIKNEKRVCPGCGHEHRDKVTGANVSVRLSDEFLSAVERGDKYQLRWPCHEKQKPTIEAWVDAREVWDEIMQSARDSAEPGLLFWDNILRESPADCYADVGYRTMSTNPCAELPLAPGDSCRLMVMNISRFITSPFTKDADFDWRRFHSTVKKAQRLMDDLVDIEIEHVDRILAKIDRDPEPEAVKHVERELWQKIRETAANGRRTGLGVTAIGDSVAMMGFRYGDEDSINFVEKVYKALAVASYESSIEMAGERGCFPVYDFRKEENHPFVSRVLDAAGPEIYAKYEKNGRRNIANLTTAPTGSVSILTQTTSGIEPVFKAMYVRRKKINPNDEGARVDFTDNNGDKWEEFLVCEHGLRKWQEVTGKTDADFQESPYYKAEAEDLDWAQRVKLQAAATRWLDHSLSSTVNLPRDVTTEQVKEIYTTAWKSGCKGITIYREGSRDGVLISKKSDFAEHSAPKRPDSLFCDVHRSRVRVASDKYEDWIFFVGLMDGRPFEIFGGVSENIVLPKKVERGWIVKRSFKSGGKYDFVYGDEEDPFVLRDIVKHFNNPNHGWATRMISLTLRHGAPLQFIMEQLGRDKDADMFDFAKCIARVFKKYVPDGTSSSEKLCPDCNAEDSLVYQEGCLRCISCGSSKCG